MTDFLSLSFDQLSQFHFIRPLWLLALVPLFMLWLAKSKSQDRTQWHQVIPPHLAQALLEQPVKLKKRLSLSLAFIWLLSVLALAGPTWQKIEKPVFQIKRASVILMDMSLSMRATDVKPDRLTKAKFKAIDLASAIGDGEVALVAYAGDAFTISPLTPDARNLTALIPSLTPEIMPEKGSYPLLGLEQAERLLQQAGYVKGDIFWITDGIDEDDLPELRQLASDSQYRISVLAVGTRQGAPIKLRDGSLLKDQTGSIVIPKLNTTRLSLVPNLTGGVFIPTTANDADIKALAALTPQQRDVEDSESADDNLLTGDDWQEFGPYLVLLLLPLVLVKFRRGESLVALLFVFMLPASGPAKANNNPELSAQDSAPQIEESWLDYVFNTRDQVGQKAYNGQMFAEAQQRFDDPQWRASAAYKNGDYDTALSNYSKDDSALGWYNRGNALAHLNKLDEAIKAYETALKKRPGFTAAQENKDLLEKMQEQEQQHQQQEGDSQQQNQDQQGGQQQQSEDSSEQQQQSQQNNQSQSSDGQQQSQQQNSASEPQPQDSSESQQQSQQQQQETAEQTAQQQQAQAGAKQDKGEQQQGESVQPLTAEQLAEQEQQQKLQQLLRKVSDDPAVLLRNKMMLENRRRQRANSAPKGAKKSW